MGCDIHSYAEVYKNRKWKQIGDVFPLDDSEKDYYEGKNFSNEPFRYRNYALFGWLANVRNYSCVESISEPKGLPGNVSTKIRQLYEENSDDFHSTSWFLLSELLAIDYEKTIWDRRIIKQTSPNFINGAAKAEEGEGEHITLKKFLGNSYFKILNILKTLGEPNKIRIVFWFDN